MIGDEELVVLYKAIGVYGRELRDLTDMTCVDAGAFHNTIGELVKVLEQTYHIIDSNRRATNNG